MSVRLFGFDIEITIGFWLTALVFGMGYLATEPLFLLVIALVLLISILAHELGHALAFKAFGVRSTIRLHFLGGATMPTIILPLSRVKNVIVSLAGPCAGFMVAIGFYVLSRTVPIENPGISKFVGQMIWANTWWSLFNLAPVLPLDGGHVVEHALGPKRYRITLGVSALAGTVLALLFLMSGSMIAVMIFGFAAVQSFIQLREVSSAVRDSKVASDVVRAEKEPIQPATARALKEAQVALQEEEHDRAMTLARGVLEGRELEGGRPQARAIAEALAILGWAQLAVGDVPAASETVARLSRTAHADPALVGTLAFARGDLAPARRLLEAARTAGDERKEVFGPLIQVLLKQGEAARAAALALDCAEQMSADDLRILAGLVAEAGVHHWAGRLHEAAFKRDRAPDDAFEAARAYARAGDPANAIDLMRRAVQAGFTDSARAYADEALVGIDELEHILPKTS